MGGGGGGRSVDCLAKFLYRPETPTRLPGNTTCERLLYFKRLGEMAKCSSAPQITTSSSKPHCYLDREEVNALKCGANGEFNVLA